MRVKTSSAAEPKPLAGRTILAIDPGLRTFATVTCINTGDVFEVGTHASRMLRSLFTQMDALASKIADEDTSADEKVRLRRKKAAL